MYKRQVQYYALTLPETVPGYGIYYLQIQFIKDDVVVAEESIGHGLMRKGESEQVIEVFRNQLGANLTYVDAVDRFLDKLAGVADPETKRKVIGAEFIRVFEEEARKLEGIGFLAQGTIYPDIIESGPVKSHHNVGGLPEDLQLELVEPVKFLFKDEVRVVGKALEMCIRDSAEAASLERLISDIPDCCTLVFVQDTDFEPDQRTKIIKMCIRDRRWAARWPTTAS